jgi:hypothetical protein
LFWFFLEKEYKNIVQTVFKTVHLLFKQFFMNHTIKDLITQWFSKSFIYDVLKQSLPLSKQFNKNKRFFNGKDVEIFKYYKIYGYEKTVLKYWVFDREEKKLETVQTVWTTVKTVQENSLKTVNKDIEKAVKEEIKTVIKQYESREEELKQTISQKEAIIKIKDDQTQKYALLKQEEKKEKEEWIEKYDVVQKEKNEWIGKYYFIKMYMVVFLVLLILASVFIVWSFLK